MKNGKPMVLVADDDEQQRQILGDLLQDEGYQVFNAANGNQAIGFLIEHGGSVVFAIVDYEMPYANGLQVIREGSEHAPNTQFILRSGTADPSVCGEAEAFGAHPVSKLMPREEFRAMLRDLVELRAAMTGVN